MIMNNQDKIDSLREAQNLLSLAEDIIRQVGDLHLEKYVADHIDSNQRMLGDGMYNRVQNLINALEEEVEE
jgi:hypothetical protein